MRISEVLNIVENNDNSIDIQISGEIGYSFYDDEEKNITTKEKLDKELKAISSLNKNVNRINLLIDSPGGSVSHALAMFYLLDQHPAEKFCIYKGVSASAATVIASVCKLENITMTSYVLILVHEARFNPYDTYTVEKLKRDAIMLETINKQIATIYSKLNGKSIEENLSIMSQNGGEGVLMSAEEAKQKGFVGNILEIHEKYKNIDNSKYKNWSKIHLDKLTNINNNLNSNNMFGRKNKLQTVATEKGDLVFAKLEKGAEGEILNSDEVVNGTYNVGDKSITIENNEIKAIVTKDVNALAIDTLTNRLSALEKTVAEKDSVIAELKSRLDELEEDAEAEITAIKNTLGKVKLEVSNPTIPTNIASNDKVIAEVREKTVYQKQLELDERNKQRINKK